jgi:hypothetical protein
MELLCSLLTGFFFWLLVFHWRRRSIARMRRLAGKLLCSAESARTRWVRWAIFAYFAIGLFWNVIGVILGRSFVLADQFSCAAVFAVVLMLGLPLTRNIALEVRERGVFCGRVGDRVSMSRLHFVPWNQIATCQWVVRSYGVVSRFDDARNCLSIAQDAISPEQKRAITAAVGQFVVVYDHDGTLLTEPDAAHLRAKWIAWRDLDSPRFQFDLQTLLLLAIVVACTANLFGLRYRNPEYQAMRKLEAFQPAVVYGPDDHVLELDFSACVNKPIDEDLVNLEPLAELRRLDLAGAPVTDAGLTHLSGLKALYYVNLANTGVTDEGIKRLRQALPGANIGKRVLWMPPGLVPLAPAPSKNKPHR